MRMGVLGAGRIGSFHAETLCAHPDVDDVVIADAIAERARNLAGNLGAVSVETVDAALRANLDAVVIAASTSAHVALVHMAADSGLPIFCEKPVAFQVEDLASVIRHTRDASVLLQVGFQRRFDAGYDEARRRIESGEIGRIYTLRMVASDREPPPAGYVPLSGGVFRDMHIHDFDVLRFLTGCEVEEVYAKGLPLGIEDFDCDGDPGTTAAVLSMIDGPLVTLTGQRDNRAGYDVRMEIAGSRGTIAVGLDARTPLRSAEEGVAWPGGEPYSGFLDRFGAAYRAELAAFVDAVLGRGVSRCTGEDALAALRVALAAGRSRAEQRPVRIDEIQTGAAAR